MADETKVIEWIAEARTVPYVGQFETGETYTLTAPQADEFINAGLARIARKRASKTTED
jgi:hypothetical protein